MKTTVGRFFEILGTSYLFQEAETAKHKFHWAVTTPIFLTLLLGSMALGVALLKAGYNVQEGVPLEESDIPGPMQLVGLFLPCWFTLGFWVKLVEKRSVATLGFSKPRNLTKFSKGLLQGSGLMTAIVLVNWLVGGYEFQLSEQQLPTTTILTAIAALLVGFFIQSGAEELWLRGWLMPILGARHSKTAAILFPITLFVLMHGWSEGQPVYTVFSLILFTCLVTLLALRDGTISGVIGLHTGWNWSAGQLFGLNITNTSFGTESFLVFQSGDNIYLSGGSGGPEWSVATFIILTLCLVWLVRNIHKSGIYRGPNPGTKGNPRPLAASPAAVTPAPANHS